MKTKEENRGKEEEIPKEKELLSDEELLEVAAGRHASVAFERCARACVPLTLKDAKECRQRCLKSNGF